MTGTAAEIVPVVSLDGRGIGSGVPGPVTQRLIADFKALTRRGGDAISGKRKGGRP
jgi:branched-chain amino acid aminotransferase